ncbi:hypothetical protein ABXS71_17040 [Bacillus infantis]|uniref:hypothetical protein n=1 Tax=Bacillus infantis TaxID=324767 RepID=UPI00344CB217
MKPLIYFTELDGEKYPVWLSLKIADDEWNKEIIYTSIQQPFDKEPLEEMADCLLNASVASDELIKGIYESEIGINLTRLKSRILFYNIDYHQISNLLIPARVIEDVLQMTI